MTDKIGPWFGSLRDRRPAGFLVCSEGAGNASVLSRSCSGPGARGLVGKSRRGLPGSCCLDGVGSETGPSLQPPEVHPLGSLKHTWAVSYSYLPGSFFPPWRPVPLGGHQPEGPGQWLSCTGRCSLPAASEGIACDRNMWSQRGSRRRQDSLCFSKQSSGCFSFL